METIKNEIDINNPMKKVFFLLLGVMLFSSCLVSASQNRIWFGKNESNPSQMIPVLLDSDGVLKTDINFSITSNWNTNVGQLTNVNDTQFENNGGTLSIIMSWFNSAVGDMACLLVGGSACEMQGDINMNGNDINMGTGNITNVNSAFFNEFVGIGTLLPIAELDVNGSMRVTENITTERIVFEDDPSLVIESNSTCIKIFGSTSIMEIC